ncbi:hypothetical protein TWF481_010705 [Arthrobotrys musiformis]|uniref:F-box domain-containing protein n=1 Tax=Arthrobotrys musiformis TaxID=47236 RepID=A0AAV9W1N8_9PEZI
MASLASLPTELLIQIFEEECLDSLDLIRWSVTCAKLQSLISSYFKINYDFQVDHPSQSSWRLIRCLLLNSRIAERFQRISLTWHRRSQFYEDTWTKKWDWTQDELTKIHDMCEKFGITDSVYPVIEKGLDSESLLVLLLCFTPNLEALDLGDVLPGVIPCYRETGLEPTKLYEIYNACMGTNYEWDPENPSETEERGEYIMGTDWHITQMSEMDTWHSGKSPQHLLWVYTAFDLNPLPPGLLNIKEFSHGTHDETTGRKDITWPYSNVIKILLLPRLEYLKLEAVTSWGKIRGYPLDGAPKWSLKRLELSNCEMQYRDYSMIAEVTSGSLESFKCALSIRQIEDYYFEDQRPTKVIALKMEKWVRELFLEKNAGTLSPGSVDVRTGGTLWRCYTPYAYSSGSDHRHGFGEADLSPPYYGTLPDSPGSEADEDW